MYMFTSHPQNEVQNHNIRERSQSVECAKFQSSEDTKKSKLQALKKTAK